MTFGQPKWSDANTDKLKELWGKGFSASQIAVQLGGITKNAVIGKVHRLGLHRREGLERKAVPHRTRGPGRKRSSQRTEPRVLREARTRKNIEATPFVPAEPFIPKPASKCITFDELPAIGLCKYIEGTKKPWTYCGHDALDDSSWCAYHKALCFPVTVTSKKFVLHSVKFTGAYR